MEFVCCKTNKPMPTIGMQDVKSSQIRQIGYDPATKTLAVTFNHGAGAHYHYPDVSEEDYQKFLKAESLGSHFGKHIKALPFTKFVKKEKATA